MTDYVKIPMDEDTLRIILNALARELEDAPPGSIADDLNAIITDLDMWLDTLRDHNSAPLIF